MDGWSFLLDGQNVSQWQCTNADHFATEGYLMLRSVLTFDQFNAPYYAYLCLRMARLTDHSFRYYIEAPEQVKIGRARYLIAPSGTYSLKTEMCYQQFGSEGSEYEVLIRSGAEGSAAVSCPWVFLGEYDYTHETSGGVVTCTGSGDTWDTCSDNTLMTFDLNACATKVAYSDTSTVTCVDTVPSGGDNYVTVYNSGTTDGVNTFQFACFAVSDDKTAASVAPSFCRKSMSSASFPTDANGNLIGAKITITNIIVSCPDLAAPAGGTVNIVTDGATTTASYECAPEYALYGDAERTCMGDDTWTGDSPSCKCIAPDPLLNGNVTVSGDGDVATYTCDVGFVLKGDQNRYCSTEGYSWNGTEPTCDTCSPLTTLSFGSISLTSEGGTTVASFSCDVGYSLDGVTSVSCQLDGTWSDTLPGCVECGALTTPNLASLSMSTNGSNTLTTFTCQTGYDVSGEATLACASDGSWSGNEPACGTLFKLKHSHLQSLNNN
ncbi:SVEP1-like protein [Mya arenaria]|uniref:SVEP1-like protein n=1 Tax=Mya arenaria TaxID=6604 RepID=A0ABY7DK76_MYAAR|nr:SVEP1-like protein [Mya arenaria]